MLTNVQIAKAKPKDSAYKLSDERGLHLRIYPNGSKLWQVRYRFDGKQKTASLGPYPDISLAKARDEREKIRQAVASGTDPVAAKKLDARKKAAEVRHSFKEVSLAWLAHWRTNKTSRHVTNVIHRLEADVYPAIGKMPLIKVEAPDLVDMVKAIESRGAGDLAKRAYQTTNQIFRYAIAHGLATRNPAADIRPSDILKPTKITNYARIEASQLGDLMKALDAYGGREVTKYAMTLLMLTFVRTGELIGAKWSEIDEPNKQWRIPAERMKMATPHIVPLSTQALSLLTKLRPLTGHREFLFPGVRSPRATMSNNTLLKTLERMGYKGVMTGHGFRGLASTVLHEHGFPHQQIELQLSHMPRNKVSAAYNHAEYLTPRAEMMQWWADYLSSVSDPSGALSNKQSHE